jgi:hypothetical protein
VPLANPHGKANVALVADVALIAETNGHVAGDAVTLPLATDEEQAEIDRLTPLSTDGGVA